MPKRGGNRQVGKNSLEKRENFCNQFGRPLYLSCVVGGYTQQNACVYYNGYSNKLLLNNSRYMLLKHMVTSENNSKGYKQDIRGWFNLSPDRGQNSLLKHPAAFWEVLVSRSLNFRLAASKAHFTTLPFGDKIDRKMTRPPNPCRP